MLYREPHAVQSLVWGKFGLNLQTPLDYDIQLAQDEDNTINVFKRVSDGIFGRLDWPVHAAKRATCLEDTLDFRARAVLG